MLCIRLSVCLWHFMLSLLDCYFTPLPLMRPVTEQQCGSLSCHIVRLHCVMIRERWTHSAGSGVINCCRGAALMPQLGLWLWLRLSQADVSFFWLSFDLFLCLRCFFSIWMVWPLSLNWLNVLMPSTIDWKDWSMHLLECGRSVALFFLKLSDWIVSWTFDFFLSIFSVVI